MRRRHRDSPPLQVFPGVGSFPQTHQKKHLENTMSVDCTPHGCQCDCHKPHGMGVAHLVACCEEPPAPIERFCLQLTADDFTELGDALNRITEAERDAWRQS